jgi:hypothetical protein
MTVADNKDGRLRIKIQVNKDESKENGRLFF